MNPLRVGVVGLGIGKKHIAGFQKHPSVQVVAVCDLNHELRETIADQFAIIGRYSDLDEMLDRESLDIVSIATPNHLHQPMALAAFARGAHVLCEKPLARSVAEANQMREAARAAGLRLMVNYSFRFREPARVLKREVEAGVIGTPYYARSIWHRRHRLARIGGWFTNPALSGGGPLIDLGIHRLDLALWLLGFPRTTWVQGTTRSLDGSPEGLEEFAAAWVRFENGASLTLETSWSAPVREKELMETRIFGTKGGLVQRNRNEGYEFEAEFYLERDGKPVDVRYVPPHSDTTTAMEHFADAILHDTPHLATADEAIDALEIIHAIYESARIGAPVEVRQAVAAALA
jgi:predicted dehydrogenase